MILFRLDASIRTAGSVSRQVADTVQSAWESTHPHSRIVHRDLAATAVPAAAWPQAVSSRGLADDQLTPEQAQARALAATLASEVTTADAYLFAVPLYNFGVSQHFKTWLDLILTDPQLAPKGDQPLLGRPATLVTVRGGGYGAGTPREGWDHSTPYLKRILADVWGLDLKVSEAELTLADVNPAMEPLRDLAKQSLAAAHESATEHGGFLAERVAASVG